MSHYLRRNDDNTLSKTWLVQRLDRPFKNPGPLGLENPFAFGGGLVNGGLSKDAMALLRPIFSFDYMGAAEFEFGSVPDALSAIAKDAGSRKLVTHTFEFDNTKIEKSWRKEAVDPEGTTTFYVLCRKGWESEVEERITNWASARYNSDLKESTNIAQILNPDSDVWEPRTGGWLELNNGFMFFVDKEMFERTAALFEVKV